MDITPWGHLVRGIGWCDQTVTTLARLVAVRNIDARAVVLRERGGTSPHTVAEVRLDERWVVLDAHYGFWFRRLDGRLMSLEELSADSAALTRDPVFNQLTPDTRDDVRALFGRVLPVPVPPTRWKTPREGASLGGRSLSWLVDIGLAVFGRAGAELFQDYYLDFLGAPDWKMTLEPDASKASLEDLAAYRTFFSARNHDLYGRHTRAEQEYQEIVDRYPSAQCAERALLFLGRLRARAAVTQARGTRDLLLFLDRYPRSAFIAVAHWELAQAYTSIGDQARADIHSSAAASDPYVGREPWSN